MLLNVISSIHIYTYMMYEHSVFIQMVYISANMYIPIYIYIYIYGGRGREREIETERKRERE